jgi:hypothetical protein
LPGKIFPEEKSSLNSSSQLLNRFFIVPDKFCCITPSLYFPLSPQPYYSLTHMLLANDLALFFFEKLETFELDFLILFSRYPMILRDPEFKTQ